jgi:hypothetical protein
VYFIALAFYNKYGKIQIISNTKLQLRFEPNKNT